MSVSLGGVELAPGLLLIGADNDTDLAMSVRPTFGAPVAQRNRSTGNTPLILQAQRDGQFVRGGVFTTAQKDQLIVLRDAGEAIELIHPLGKWWVVIPADGIQLVPFLKKQTPLPTDAQIGNVMLTTLGAKHV